MQCHCKLDTEHGLLGDDEDDADEMIVDDVGDAGTSFRRLHNNLSLSSSTSIFSSILVVSV